MGLLLICGGSFGRFKSREIAKQEKRVYVPRVLPESPEKAGAVYLPVGVQRVQLVRNVVSFKPSGGGLAVVLILFVPDSVAPLAVELGGGLRPGNLLNAVV